MNKIFIILVSLALFGAHVARGNAPDPKSDEGAAPVVAAAPEKPETCTGARGVSQPGDRYCASETTHRVCNYGEWIDGDCPPTYKCEENKDLKQVLCRLIIRNAPWPTGPTEPQTTESKPSRARRNINETAPAPEVAAAAPEKPETCQSDRGTFNTGDRYCASESTSRVCSYGDWVDFQCDPGSTCMENKDLKQVLCRKIVKNTDNGQSAAQNTEPQPAGTQNRARRDIAPQDKTCNSERGTFRHGDRYCSSDSTNRVCSYGEWFDFQCDPGSKCEENRELKQVLCRIIVLNPRNRRDADDAADDKKSCTSDQGTFQHGDSYCASESMSRICSYGQWFENECPAEYKCKENKELKQVLCRKKVLNAQRPTGPSGSDNTEPQSKQPAQAQPNEKPQAQPSSGSQTESHAQPQASPESPVPAAPAQDDKVCPGDLREGQTVCSGETSYKMCSNGQLIEQQCDPNAKCVASLTVKAVVCQEIRRNAANQAQQQGQRRR